MKNFVLLLLLTFGSETVVADCSMSGITFFPEEREIGLNSKFIIQGYALSQKTINSFKNKKVYLESETGELIELNLEEIHVGQMQLTQAIFCSYTELKPNTKYFINYADQSKNEKRESVYWRTTDKKELEPLKSNLKIEFEKTEVIHYGCGPVANAIFVIKNNPKSEIWYKTEVVDLSSDVKKTFYIKAQNAKLNVGHGMCSGAFRFKNKGKYKVRFTPMNTEGKSLKTTDWTTFKSPFMNQ